MSDDGGLIGSYVRSSSGKTGEVIFASVMLDLALLRVVDGKGVPTGENAMLKSLKGLRAVNMGKQLDAMGDA